MNPFQIADLHGRLQAAEERAKQENETRIVRLLAKARRLLLKKLSIKPRNRG